MCSEKYDAIVVGAGPGGATAAYGLARSGMRTLLIDKARLPRYKTCGGGVTEKVVRTLPFSIEPVVERVVRKVDFSWKMGDPFVAESKQPLVHMVQRSKFDHYLVERAVEAGAVLMDGVAVKEATADGHGALVRTAKDGFAADYLVGADGATGRVARGLGLMQNRQAMPAIESEIEADPQTMAYWHDTLGLDLGSLYASYGWVFPKGDHLSVGVGGYPFLEKFGTLLKEYDEAHTRARVPGISRVIATHGYLLPMRRPGEPIQKGRALLIGDAAGLVETFTGEGIYWAVRSGQIAARSIVESAQTGKLPEYQRRLDRALTPDLLAARRWMHVYFWMPRACYILPKRVPIFWQAVCNIVRGDSHFRQIGRKLGPLGFVESLMPYTFQLQRENT
jgi:geranylgeranyl reductase family protein